MLPDVARLVRITLPLLLVSVIAALVLRSLGTKSGMVQAAEQRVAAAELDREAAAARAAPIVVRAVETRAATVQPLARVESLRSRVRISGPGQLRVQDTGAAAATVVPVPPLVVERIEADSAAISALSLALTWDQRAAAAQQDQLVAEAKVSDAARLTIKALEREREPRCGRRCGMVLGAASVVALGIAVDQTRRLVR